MPHRHGHNLLGAGAGAAVGSGTADAAALPGPTLTQSPSPVPPSPSPSPSPANSSLQQPERRRSSLSLVRKLSHSHHFHSHSHSLSLSPSAHSHSAPLQDDRDQQQRQPLLTTTSTTSAESQKKQLKDKDKDKKPAIASMLLSFAKKMKLSDKDKDKGKSFAAKDAKHQHPARSVSHDDINHQPGNPTTTAAEIDLSLLPMPATADPGPPPPIATFTDLPSPADMHADDDQEDQDLDFESTLDINISTLTSTLSTALSRLAAFTNPLVCDRDLDLPDECRLASTLTHHLVATYLPSKHLPQFTSPSSPSHAIRPKDAATYLTSILARHFLTKLAQALPRHASDAATRAAARQVTYHFLRADALGAMHVALPPFWAQIIADLCEWVESTLAEQFSFSDSLFTSEDRERVHHAARACALATAMMRVVHPQLSYAWIRPGVCVSDDEVRVPVEEWVGERPPASGAGAVRVAYCVFPKVDESETGLDEAGIWKAVVVGYIESDPAMAAGGGVQQQQQQIAPVTQQPMPAQGLPPRTSSKAPAPAAVQHESAPRSLPMPPVVAQQHNVQPLPAAVAHHPSAGHHLDARAPTVPPTVPQQHQQYKHQYPPAAVVHHHQPATNSLPAYCTLDQLAPHPPTTTTTTPSAPAEDHDDDPAPLENPLTLACVDDSDTDDEHALRTRDQAMVMSALNQDFVVQTSLDAASAAAAAAAAADGDAGATGYQVFDEMGAMQSR